MILTIIVESVGFDYVHIFLDLFTGLVDFFLVCQKKSHTFQKKKKNIIKL